MNVNQIINMILRIIMRKAISKGIDAGMNRATRGRGQAKRKLNDIPPEEMTPKPVSYTHLTLPTILLV